MTLKLRMFNYFFPMFVKLFKLNIGSDIWCYILERFKPIKTAIKGNLKFSFFTPNQLTLFRVDTLFSKEPETIEWIDEFDENDIMYDIGANVGVYSIYGGVAKKNLKVFAFEPTSFNYALLNKNIALNNLQNRVSALNIALTNKDVLDYLYIPNDEDGSALVNFGENVGYDKKEFKVQTKQAVLGFTLDTLIKQFKLPYPNHIKIDVDGLEKEIIEGAGQTLSSPNLKSILIELNDNLEEDKKLIDIICEHGFVVKHKKHAPLYDTTEYKNTYNYVFIRTKS